MTEDPANSRHYGGNEPTPIVQGVVPEAVAAVQEMASDMYRQGEFVRLSLTQETRDSAPHPDEEYEARSHEELHRMVNDDLDPDSMNARGEVVNQMGDWLAEVSTAANDAVSKERAQWQGAGAGKAHALFSSNATWADGTSQAAYLSANRYAEQADAAAQARTAMPPPTTFDQEAEVDQVIRHIASGDFEAARKAADDFSAKQQHAQDQHAEAVRVLQTMDDSYLQTARTQPAFAPPPDPAGAQTGTTASSFVAPAAAGGAPVNAAAGGAPTPGGTTGGGAAPPLTGGPRSVGAAPPPSGQASPPSSYGTQAGGPSAGRPAGGAAAAYGGANMRGVGSEQERTSRGFRRGPAGQRASGGPTAPKSPSAGKGGEPGSARGRVVGTGGGKPATPEAKAPGNSTGSGQPSKGANVVRGGPAAAAGAPGTSGGRGMAGAPGAGRGNKDEDKEHQSKYDYGDDPEEMYAPKAEYGPDGQKIVPPVLGDK